MTRAIRLRFGFSPLASRERSKSGVAFCGLPRVAFAQIFVAHRDALAIEAQHEQVVAGFWLAQTAKLV